jgi:hypothetical protein
MARGGDARIGDEQRARDAEALELPARVGGRAGPNLIGVASSVKTDSWSRHRPSSLRRR